MRAIALCLLAAAACHSEATRVPPAPSGSAAPGPGSATAVAAPVTAAPMHAAAAPTPAGPTGSIAPPGTVGTCRANPPKVAGVDDGHQPVANAACPTPMEMSRGNGLDSVKDPPVSPSITPGWDLDATRDYACAYACAAPGSKAYLLGWSIEEDDRPLRNHHAAYLIEHASTEGPPKWTIVIMYRHSWNQWWNIITSMHSPTHAVIDAPRRPTVAETEQVLAENGWRYAADGGFKLLAAHMVDEAWSIALGGPPTQRFPKGVEP
ncbi:MAG TPA: hypothetical protein VH165_03240 [Kofleriaceae bacterium]|jgi:hypothetical protein|nr:hypothetical protein [Kofleriaceae bacterium]